MTTRRKTIRIADLIHEANVMLAADGSTPDGRIAIAVLVERLLMDANAYRGYGYQRSQYLPAAEQTADNVMRPDYDETRRVYFGGAA